MFLVCEIARIVDDADDRLLGGNAAGGVNLIGGILAGPQAGFVLIDRWKRPVQHKKDLVKVRLTELLIAVKAGLGINADQIRRLELSNMVCQCAVRDIQPLRKFIHAHFSVLQKQSQNFNADIGTERLENLKAFRKSFDISHRTSLDKRMPVGDIRYPLFLYSLVKKRS